MIRIFMAELSNETSSSLNDTTLFDKVWKVKAYLQSGLGNVEISDLMTAKSGALRDKSNPMKKMTTARVSMMVQVEHV